MGNYSEAEEDKFFDACEEVSSVSDLGSDCSEDCSSSRLVNCVSSGFGYEFWTKNMENVHVRRDRFLRWMELSLDRHPSEREEVGDICCDEVKLGIDKIGERCEHVLGDSDFQDRFLSSRSFLSCPSDEALEQVDAMEENLMCTIRNLDDGTEFLVDELGPDGMLSKLRVVGSNQMVTIEEFQETVGSSSLVQRLLQKNSETCKLVDATCKLVDAKKKVKRSWIRKLGVMARMVDRKGEVKSKVGARMGSVHVHSYRKRLKELSSLYAGQDFPAHKGSILTMKFSHDGQYLASGGEDNVVRVWKVVEDERPSTFDISDSDPSCLYFSLNHLSKFAPLEVDKEKIEKVKKLSKSSKSACVIFPPKIFRVLEKPLHEFHGHSGEVLALSWSKKGVSMYC